MGDFDFKGVGEHFPVISTAIISLAVIVGTVMKGYSWLSDSWRSSITDAMKGINKDLSTLEKRLDKLEEKIEERRYDGDHSIWGKGRHPPD